jgi:hypothetical protein
VRESPFFNSRSIYPVSLSFATSYTTSTPLFCNSVHSTCSSGRIWGYHLMHRKTPALLSRVVEPYFTYSWLLVISTQVAWFPTFYHPPTLLEMTDTMLISYRTWLAVPFSWSYSDIFTGLWKQHCVSPISCSRSFVLFSYHPSPTRHTTHRTGGECSTSTASCACITRRLLSPSTYIMTIYIYIYLLITPHTPLHTLLYPTPNTTTTYHTTTPSFWFSVSR